MASHPILIEDDDQSRISEGQHFRESIAPRSLPARNMPTATTHHSYCTPLAPSNSLPHVSSNPAPVEPPNAFQSSTWSFPSTSQICFTSPSISFTATSTSHALKLAPARANQDGVSALVGPLKIQDQMGRRNKQTCIALDSSGNNWCAEGHDDSMDHNRAKRRCQQLSPESVSIKRAGTVVDLSEEGAVTQISDAIGIENVPAQTPVCKSHPFNVREIRDKGAGAMDIHHKQSFAPLTPNTTSVPAGQCLEQYTYNGVQLSPKVTVELTDGDFMRIVHISKDLATERVFLKGNLFRRMKYMNGTLEKKLNEVCWILYIDKSDPRHEREQALQEVHVTQVVKRRALKLTNQAFPALRYSTETSTKEPTSLIESCRVLVCRWKYVCFYADAAAKKRNLHSEKALIRLREVESDIRCGCSDDMLRQQSRGETISGGESSSIGLAEWEQMKRETVFREEAVKRSTQQLRFPRSSLVSKDKSIRHGSTASTPTNIDTLQHSDFLADKVCPTNQNSPGFSTNASATPKWRQGNSNGRLRSQIGLSLDNEDVSLQTINNGQRRPPVELTISSDDDSEPDIRRLSAVSHISLTDDEVGLVPQPITQLAVVDVETYVGTVMKPKAAGVTYGSYIKSHGSFSRRLDPARTPRKDYHLSSDTPAIEVQLSTYENLPIKSNSTPSLSSGALRPVLSTFSDSIITGSRSSSVISLEDDELDNQTCKDRLVATFHAHQRSSRRLKTDGNSSEGSNIQRYTLGDGFCGSGGVSRGAATAGLCVKWAFDHAEPMCETYYRNFPGTMLECVSAFDFATSDASDYKVDILHLSPPCQFYSPAHTTVGKNDEENVASSFVITELIKKAKPRIVTLENTLGLEQRHPTYLNAVVQQFTSLGFSIRWKIIDLRDFGVPQSRRRLILLASCPGEVLPDFPPRTHSSRPEETGLRPWTTINETIGQIPTDWPNHNIAISRHTDLEPYDGNVQAKCITCSGGINNHHPSGKRKYTIREYACLQTFPLEHIFAAGLTKTILKQQIGNSVPPIFYKCLAEHIVKCLRKVDGILEVSNGAEGAGDIDTAGTVPASTTIITPGDQEPDMIIID